MCYLEIENNYLKLPTKYFILSQDGRFCEFFRSDNNVIIASTYDDILSHVKIVSTKSEKEPTEERLVSAIEKGNITIKEPTELELKIRDLLTTFRYSGSFYGTHQTIKELKTVKNGFSVNDEIDILNSAITNSQIYWILSDADVIEFLLPIFNKYKAILSKEQYNDFIRMAELKDYKPM